MTPDMPIVDNQQFRHDSELGDLACRFKCENGCIPTNEEVRALKSRLVVVDQQKQEEHNMHSGPLECYQMDNAREHEHSFKNGTELPNPQTNPLIPKHYPQGCDYFSDILSVVHFGGGMYE